MEIRLTEGAIAPAHRALDSHDYWRLSESHERNGGDSIEDGENDEVDDVRALTSRSSNDRRHSRCASP
jgi:hypothetical protein